MSSPTIFAITGAALICLGLYGMLASRHLLRQILAFNIIGSGIFLLLGVAGGKGVSEADPVPQALIITGIVVALSATALAVMLAIRLQQESDREDHDG